MNKKPVYSIFIVLCLLLAIFTARSRISAKAGGVIHVPADYPTIQQAIDNANPGDVVFVSNGTYYENLYINKSLSLIGDIGGYPRDSIDHLPTVIDGSMKDCIINVTCDAGDHVMIRLLNLRNAKTAINGQGGSYTIDLNNIMNVSSYGVHLLSSSGNHVEFNNIVGGFGEILPFASGIVLHFCSDSTVVHNNVRASYYGIIVSGRPSASDSRSIVSFNNVSGPGIEEYGQHGITLLDGESFEASGNSVAWEEFGVELMCSNSNFSKNTFGSSAAYEILLDGNAVNNTLIENDINGLLQISSGGNHTIYHNNNLIANVTALSVNIWDDGYPDGGNYWIGFNGTDTYSGIFQNETGLDWIGDNPYAIDQTNRDRYPLMVPYVPEVDDIRVAYRGLQHNVNQLRSDLDISNSSLTVLNENLTGLQQEYLSLLGTVNSLDRQIGSANSALFGLNQSLSNLQSQIDSVNSTLQTRINTLQDQYTSLANTLNNVLYVVYVLVAIAVILFVGIVYIARRIPEKKKET